MERSPGHTSRSIIFERQSITAKQLLFNGLANPLEKLFFGGVAYYPMSQIAGPLGEGHFFKPVQLAVALVSGQHLGNDGPLGSRFRVRP